MAVVEPLSYLPGSLGTLAKRVRGLLSARTRARKLGFVDYRAAGFTMPDRIDIGSRPVKLVFPNEPGCAPDFIGALLEDGYGVERILAASGPTRTIVDIGANVGWFSLAARHNNPFARI